MDKLKLVMAVQNKFKLEHKLPSDSMYNVLYSVLILPLVFQLISAYKILNHEQ